MAIKSKWSVVIQSLRTTMRVGLHSHEYDPQPVQITLKVSSLASSDPESIDQCVDFDPLVRWLSQTLPTMPGPALLENRVNDIAQYVFSADKRILGVWVALYKEAAVNTSAFIGVEKEMTRRQFEDLQRKRKLRSAAAVPAVKRSRKAALT